MDRKEVKGAVAGAVNSASTRHRGEIVTHQVPSDGPQAIHLFNPLAPGERPAGRPTPSDLPATPAKRDRRGRPVRRLRTPSLPALGVAVGLVAVFLTLVSTAAQAQGPALVEVWSETMRVGVEVSSPAALDIAFTNHGYDPESGDQPLGGISSGNFNLNGVEYAISRLAYWTRSGSAMSPRHQQLNIHTGNELPTGAVFELDGARFPITSESRYYSPTPGRHEWDHPGLNWRDGAEVKVRLLVPVITAEVIDARAFHDGSSTFRVRVRFSKELVNDAWEVVQAFAAKTTGGKVTDAGRVGSAGMGGEDWDIYVKPDGNGDVIIRLHTGGQCHLPGQLCSKDAQRVGKWLQEVRSGAWVQAWTDTTIPLLTRGVTATVVEAPSQHDGWSLFDVRIKFDDELFNSYLKVMRAFGGTTGGTVVRTRPVVRRDGTQDGTLWNVTVKPDGRGDVVLALKTGGPCQDMGQPCSKDWKWITNASDFPLTVSARRGEPAGVWATSYSPSWSLRAGTR